MGSHIVSFLQQLKCCRQPSLSACLLRTRACTVFLFCWDMWCALQHPCSTCTPDRWVHTHTSAPSGRLPSSCPDLKANSRPVSMWPHYFYTHETAFDGELSVNLKRYFAAISFMIFCGPFSGPVQDTGIYTYAIIVIYNHIRYIYIYTLYIYTLYIYYTHYIYIDR
jgi:hypothetical protein